jgi:DNA-binding beta-propeller fold protein YncE
VINTVSATVEKTLSTSPEPFAVACHPVRDELWVGYNTTGTALRVFSAADDSVLAELEYPMYASTGLDFSPDGNVVYGTEACGTCGRFHKLSGNHTGGAVTVLAAGLLSGGGWATGVAVHPSHGSAYFAQQGQGTSQSPPRITEIPAAGANRTLALAKAPCDLAVARDGSRLYVTLGNSLLVVDTLTFSAVAEVPLGKAGLCIAVGMAGQTVGPTIPKPPEDQTIAPGASATLSVVATGAEPLSYQWYLGPSGQTGSPIEGAKAAAYTTPPLTDTASYWVRVSGGDGGSTDSRTATVSLNQLKMFAGLVISGPIGAAYRIEFAPNVGGHPSGWQTLTNLTLTTNPEVFIDDTSPNASSRFYQAIKLP